MEQYQNRDGVLVNAERIVEGEHAGLWHTVDTNGVEGYVSEELFQRNFTLASAVKANATAPAGKG